MTIRCIFRWTRLTHQRIPSQQIKLFNRVNPCTKQLRQLTSQSWQPTLDFDYLSDPKNHEEIENNIKSRNAAGCLNTVKELLLKFNSIESETEEKLEIKKKLVAEALKIPNKSDPRLAAYGDTPHLVEAPGVKPDWQFPPLEFHVLAKELDILRTENLGNLTGPRSYFIEELAELEQALIYFTVDALLEKGFTLYSVPDLLHSRLIESCGMDTKSQRTQVLLFIRLI